MLAAFILGGIDKNSRLICWLLSFWVELIRIQDCLQQGHSNIKMLSYRYRNLYSAYKTIPWWSYLHYGILHTTGQFYIKFLLRISFMITQIQWKYLFHCSSILSNHITTKFCTICQNCRVLGHNRNLIAIITSKFRVGVGGVPHSSFCKIVNLWMVSHATQAAVNFVLEIRWRLRISNAEPSSSFQHKICHRKRCVLSIRKNKIPQKLICGALQV